ncbi:MAG: ribonuclease J [Turicibacter sp.]|nr:ribonuclease J [Turicibacter sp.]
MSNTQDKVKIFALGGLDEVGNNLYVVDVNGRIFILDAGMKYPSGEMLGVDAVIPDFTYLIENQNRIKGIFITQGHDEHMGSIAQLMDVITAPIYGTRLTMALVEDSLIEAKVDLSKVKLNIIRDENTLYFDGVKVSFFKTTHSIPGSVAVCIHTSAGAIVYTSDFVFNHSVSGRYQTNYNKISDIARNGVLCLLAESANSESMGHASIGDTLEYTLEEAFSRTEGRIICSLFSTDLHRIQMVVNLAIKYNRKVAITGRRMQRLIDLSVKLGYLKIPKPVLMSLGFMNANRDNNLPDLVVITTGTRAQPFVNLTRMIKGHDRFIRILKTDNVILATPPQLGTETRAARTLDMLYRTDANVIAIKKDLLPPSHASSEDLKLMMNLLKPAYVMPVNGEYRHLLSHAKVAKSMGYDDENIIIMDNGEVALFEQGQLIANSETIELDEVLVDGHGVGDVGTVVLKDRQMLSNDGVVAIVINLDRKTKKIVSGPEIVSRGFVFDAKYATLFEEAKEIARAVIEEKAEASGRYFNWQDLRFDMRDRVGKFIQKTTKHRPIVIPIIEEFNL